jgi:hypothetical protein
VARVGDRRGAQKVLVGKSERKTEVDGRVLLKSIFKI